jgi:hypothetical protein
MKIDRKRGRKSGTEGWARQISTNLVRMQFPGNEYCREKPKPEKRITEMSHMLHLKMHK